jgi:hypothetical protein
MFSVKCFHVLAGSVGKSIQYLASHNQARSFNDALDFANLSYPLRQSADKVIAQITTSSLRDVPLFFRGEFREAGKGLYSMELTFQKLESLSKGKSVPELVKGEVPDVLSY